MENNKLKILHINCNYITTALHKEMIKKLQDIGFDNTVFVPTYDSSRAVVEVNNNVHVSECFKKWDRIFFDYKQSKIFRSITHEFDISQYDCLHAYTLYTDGNCAFKLHKLYNVPYVVAVRSTDVNTFFKYKPHLIRRGVQIMLNAKAVFFLSDSYMKKVLNKYVPKKYYEEIKTKSYIIPNGIDDFWFANKQTQANQKIFETAADTHEPLRLFYVGRINKNKNIRAIISAIEVLKQRGQAATLTVVGKIESNEEYEIIKESKDTEYYPLQDKEALVKMYRQHDIFVMPSFNETFGLVYAEAMSQGLPVIYTAGEGFDGQFPNGTVGYAIDPNNPQTIADAILNVKDNYALLANNCLSNVDKFEWDRIISQYSILYSNIYNK